MGLDNATTSIGEGRTKIGQVEFDGDDSLVSVKISASVREIGAGAFMECPNLEEVVFEDGSDALLYRIITSPNPEEVAFEESLVTVRKEAFAKCPRLRRVKLPSTLRLVESRAFSECTALEDVVATNNLFQIVNSAVASFRGLKNLSLPGAVRENAFASCRELKSLSLPGAVREIEECVFKGCKKLERVELGDGLEAIRPSAFAECPRLRHVKLPSTLRIIDSLAFFKCTSIEDMILPDHLCKIGNKAFASCHGLKGISLPASLREVGSYAFGDCRELERADVSCTIGKDADRDASFCRILFLQGEGLFSGCDSLKDLVVHEGVTDIPEKMCETCAGLKTISLPSTLKRVNKLAFPKYRGRPIVMPKGIRSVCKNAFGLENAKAIVPLPCKGEHLSCGFPVEDYELVVGFIAEGEKRLAEDAFDANAFCHWFRERLTGEMGSWASTGNGIVLLEAMKEHSRLLDARMLVNATDEAISVWADLAGRNRVETCDTANETRFIMQAFGEILRQDISDEAGRKRKTALVSVMVSNRAGWTKPLWDKLAEKGKLPPIFEAIAGDNHEARREFERIRKLTNGSSKFQNSELKQAAEQGHFAEFMMRLSLLGLKMDARMLAKLFKCHASECIVAAYQREEAFERQLPLRLVILAVCQNWPVEKGAGFVELVEKMFPGICAGTFDACGCSPLWHCLYNLDCFRGDCNPKWKENPLVKSLLTCGCDPMKENSFGLSFDSVTTRMRKNTGHL